MNQWKRTRIGTIAEVKGGKRLPKGEAVQSEITPYPYIRIVDFTSDGLDPTKVKYITEEARQAVKRYTIGEDDVYISIAGTVGLVGMVPATLTGANLTENAAKITSIDTSVDPHYLMYFLRSSDGQAQIKSKTGGVAQPKLALYRIEEIEFPLAPLHVQRRIASILRAYDDLIFVNRRRIALLEEMGRRLFEEWFVCFRFPGHDDRTIETPEGPMPKTWQLGTLGTLIELAYGRALKADDRIPGDVPVIGSSGVIGSHNAALVKGPGIVVGRKGNVGSIIWSPCDFYPIDTVFYVETSQPLLFVLHQLQRLVFLNSDAAVPGLNRNAALGIRLKIPPVELMTAYEVKVAPIIELADQLRRSNSVLSATRELLLPGLLSGAVSISVAEQEMEAAA